MTLPLAYQSRERQVEFLKSSIATMKKQGKKTDFLEERLRDLDRVASAPVDLFTIENPINRFIHISEEEAAQMETFGYVVFGNPSVNKMKLRATEQYQKARAEGKYLGF